MVFVHLETASFEKAGCCSGGVPFLVSENRSQDALVLLIDCRCDSVVVIEFIIPARAE
jgi:hypothetical protein